MRESPSAVGAGIALICPGRRADTWPSWARTTSSHSGRSGWAGITARKSEMSPAWKTMKLCVEPQRRRARGRQVNRSFQRPPAATVPASNRIAVKQGRNTKKRGHPVRPSSERNQLSRPLWFSCLSPAAPCPDYQRPPVEVPKNWNGATLAMPRIAYAGGRFSTTRSSIRWRPQALIRQSNAEGRRRQSEEARRSPGISAA